MGFTFSWFLLITDRRGAAAAAKGEGCEMWSKGISVCVWERRTLIWCCRASSMVLRAQQWASCNRCSLLWCSLCISADGKREKFRFLSAVSVTKQHGWKDEDLTWWGHFIFHYIITINFDIGLYVIDQHKTYLCDIWICNLYTTLFR